MTSLTHVRLTAEGTLGLDAGNEIWSCSIKVGVWNTGAPTVLVTPVNSDLAELGQVAADAWQNFISNPSVGGAAAEALFCEAVNVIDVKAAAIGADGHYEPTTTPVISLPAAANTRGVCPPNVFPSLYQVALAVTLRGDTYVRGSGALGRFYLPCPNMAGGAVGTGGHQMIDGLLDPAAVSNFSLKTAALLDAINGAGPLTSGKSFGIVNIGASEDIAGTRWQKVSKVIVDSRPDTIRRRYSALSGRGKVTTALA